MRKTTTSVINLGEDRTKTIVRILGDECSPDTQVAFTLLMILMREVVDMPLLLNCAGNAPTEVSFKHTGTRWVIEAQVVTTKDRHGQASAGSAQDTKG